MLPKNVRWKGNQKDRRSASFQMLSPQIFFPCLSPTTQPKENGGGNIKLLIIYKMTERTLLKC